jgi:hypothetical protein
MQEAEIAKYRNRIADDLKDLVEKYRRAMDWDVPENDQRESDRLIFREIRAALDRVEDEIRRT